MRKGDYLAAILRSDKTIFTIKDLALLWGEPASPAIRVRLNYYVKTGRLLKLRKGIYAKGRNYNPLELATRIFTPAYVSFETVLASAGLIFQYYRKIFVASYLTREIEVDGQTFTFRKLKDVVLTNPIGIEHRDQTSIATLERAFLDTLYIHVDYHFDNLAGLNWEKVLQILPIYANLRLEKRVSRLRQGSDDYDHPAYAA